MSAMIGGPKVFAYNNIYTAVLALAVAAVVSTAVFVVVECYLQYATIFKIVIP